MTKLTNAQVYNIRAMGEDLPQDWCGWRKARHVQKRLALPVGLYSIKAVIMNESFVEPRGQFIRRAPEC